MYSKHQTFFLGIKPQIKRVYNNDYINIPTINAVITNRMTAKIRKF